jgi:ABC-type branched-subunit amino acid transport system ATPase component
VLEKVGLGELDPRLPLSTLSIALQQLVAISRATVTDSKVLILDEPTSSLDANEVENLFTVIRALRDEGVAILFVSHFLDQIYAISDRMTVLRNGTFQGEFMTADIDQSTLIATMVGKEMGALDSLERASARREVDRSGDPVYSAEGLGRKGTLEPTDVTLHAGEVLGVAGLLGSGRTELARLVYGADKPEAGTVRLKGSQAQISSPSQALAARIAYASENRRDEGIIRDLSVRENLILGVQAKRGWARPLPTHEKNALVEKYMSSAQRAPGRPGPADQQPLRRQPAEGPAGPLARDPARRADPRRAHPRHRHRRQDRDHGGGHRPGRRGRRRRVHLLRARRGRAPQRPGDGAQGPPASSPSSPPATPSPATPSSPPSPRSPPRRTPAAPSPQEQEPAHEHRQPPPAPRC